MDHPEQRHSDKQVLPTLMVIAGLLGLSLLAGCQNNERAEARLVDEVSELEEPGTRPITEPPPAMEYDPDLE